MVAPQWRLPSKQKGSALVQATHKWPLPLILALREYAARESLRLDRKVSQATILRTLALQDPELKRLYLQHAHKLRQQPKSSSGKSDAA